VDITNCGSAACPGKLKACHFWWKHQIENLHNSVEAKHKAS